MPGVARQNLLKPYLVTDGRKFRLKDVKPSDTAGLNAAFKDRAKALLLEGVEKMSAL